MPPAETHAAWEASIACVATAGTLQVTAVGWDSMQDRGAVERCRFLRTWSKGRIEGISLLKVKEQSECMEFFYGTDDRQLGSLWVRTCHRCVKGLSSWEFLIDHLMVRRKQNYIFRKFEEVSVSQPVVSLSDLKVFDICWKSDMVEKKPFSKDIRFSFLIQALEGSVRCDI